MALLFCDGFDHYATADLAKKWSYISNYALISASYARYGTGGLQTSETGCCITPAVAPIDTFIFGMAVYWNSIGTVGVQGIVWGEDDATHQVGLAFTTSNRLCVVRGGRTGTVLGTSTKTFSIGVWYYIEAKIKVHSSTGTVEVRVNGETWLSLTGKNTQATANAQVTKLMVGYNDASNHTCNVDDFYFCDTSGSVNNDFLGDIRVQSIFPTGAGTTTQMTPSAGSNYTCVDEAAPNGDTDYVSETTAGEKDTYAFGNLTPTSGTIKGVQVLINARKDDAGFRTIAPVYRPVSTDYDGTAQAVSDSYSYLREITEVSPATSAAWTIAEINGAEFGVTLKA